MQVDLTNQSEDEENLEDCGSMLEDECLDGNTPSNSLSDEDSADEDAEACEEGLKTRINGQ